MKKFFVALACMVVVLTATVVYASEYIWLEAEDGIVSGYTVEENTSASGGSIAVIHSDTEPENDKYSISFDINTQGGSYDIWALTNSPSLKNFSKYNWSIGDVSGTGGEKCEDVYKHKLALINQNITWTKLASAVEIASGENTFEINISERAQSSPKRYTSAVDCIVIVSTEYGYDPGADIILPEKLPARFAWIEMENPDNETFIGKVSSSNAGGGKMLYLYDGKSPDGEMTEELNYSFNLDDSGDYEIWYLGAETNVAHLSTVLWSVNDGEVSKKAEKKHGVKIMDSPGAASLPIYWHKLGEEALEAGANRLNISYTYRNLTGSVRSHVIWGDCVAIVPKEWGFTPPGDSGASDRFADFEVARLDAKYFVEKYITEEFDSVTDDIILPDTDVLTPGGSKITGYGSDSLPIDGTGAVTRPYFDKGDISFIFPVNAENNGCSSYYGIPVTVKAFEKYNIGEIKVTGSLSDEMSASADVYLNVSDESEITGSAMLICALYDSDDTLISIATDESDVTREKKTFTATVINAEKTEDVYLKVYLLNNRQLANKLCETKIVK